MQNDRVSAGRCQCTGKRALHELLKGLPRRITIKKWGGGDRGTKFSGIGGKGEWKSVPQTNI